MELQKCREREEQELESLDIRKVNLSKNNISRCKNKTALLNDLQVKKQQQQQRNEWIGLAFRYATTANNFENAMFKKVHVIMKTKT